jgi:uncharacterized protein YdhG (YjbR/CyaY superfamily)
MDRLKKYQTIDEYISLFPENIRELLTAMRRTISAEAPGAEEAIRYGMPTFRLNGNLVHFAAFKDHIGFFPTSSPIVNFKEELKDYKTSKGTIQFPLDKPIPFDLVKKIVRFRVGQSTMPGN